MKILLSIIAACCVSLLATGREVSKTITTPLSKYSKEWDNPKYAQCNTAANAAYLTQNEKDIIYVLNMVRMSPQLYCKTILKNIKKINGSIDTSSEVYYKSLVKTMMKMKPLPLLKPDSLCAVSARAHATASGQTGYTGHVRQTPESRKAAHFGGECCYYGTANAAFVILELLVDEGVESLGHRHICFGEFASIGTGIAPHKTYGNASVLDFGYR